MAYQVNTSKTHRLPINFFWDFYALIPDLADVVQRLETDSNMDESDKAVLNEVLANMRRQRQSHLGCEEL